MEFSAHQGENNVHRIFQKIGQYHKKGTDQAVKREHSFQKIKNIWATFSDHNAVKLLVNGKKQHQKP